MNVVLLSEHQFTSTLDLQAINQSNEQISHSCMRLVMFNMLRTILLLVLLSGTKSSKEKRSLPNSYLLPRVK